MTVICTLVDDWDDVRHVNEVHEKQLALAAGLLWHELDRSRHPVGGFGSVDLTEPPTPNPVADQPFPLALDPRAFHLTSLRPRAAGIECRHLRCDPGNPTKGRNPDAAVRDMPAYDVGNGLARTARSSACAAGLRDGAHVPTTTMIAMALVPQRYLDALVALEQPEGGGSSGRAVATGFLVGFDSGERDDTQQTLYRTFLVTNRHVVEDEDRLVAKFNRGDEATRYDIGLLDASGAPVWASHDSFDIAVIPVRLDELRHEGAEFAFVTDENMLDLDGMDELQVGAGYSVFVLGFPMGLAGVQRKYAVVRAGHIARIDREIVDDPDYRGYLLDATIYPGNSGGPVVLAPNPSVIEGSPSVSTLYVIGVVSSYIPYTETAVSIQTRQPRITFQENSGLAVAVPLDAVRAAARPLMKLPLMGPNETASEQDAPSQHAPPEDAAPSPPLPGDASM
jgi:hypothetical protein